MNEDRNEGPSAEMPRYQCHKRVWALKIKEVRMAPADQERQFQYGDWLLVPEDAGYAPIVVGHAEFYEKHNPQPGGYYVVYDDGYKSYSPAKAFEDGYAAITAAAPQPVANRVTEAELIAKSVAPRVTQEMLEANIAAEYTVMAENAVGAGVPTLPALRLLTLHILVLRNGFTIVGTSACASPENFDADIGARLARADAIRQCWPLMGYALKDRLTLPVREAGARE